MKFSSTGNPFIASMFFIAAQFITQILLGAYFISKTDFEMDYNSLKYGISGGIAAAVAAILFFLALEQASLSNVVPIVNIKCYMFFLRRCFFV